MRTVPAEDVPLALAELHRTLEVGAQVELSLDGTDLDPQRIDDLLTGAGFTEVEMAETDEGHWEVQATRARTLPDTVGPAMHVLICGLNPSLYAADAGVGFARPGNRFWPAATQVGLVAQDRDPYDALANFRVGMTDLVKRATAAASELTAAEYQAGAERVGRLVAWLEPEAVCFVGLAGWRAAFDRKAAPGWQDQGIGDRPAYVMPSTSGLNARTPVSELAEHLRRAAVGP